MQNAAAEVSKITQKHTKTHKYTEIKKLFYLLRADMQRAASEDEDEHDDEDD
jgi:hypothetical protein